MAFDEVQFPAAIMAYGTAGGPGHKTQITETDSGHEERVGKWTYPRHRLRVELLSRSNMEIAEIRRFAIARQGALRGFRAKDWNDFTTNEDGVSAATDADVQIGVGDASETDFQLSKLYTSGLSTITRKIIKPVDGTDLVAIDGVAQIGGVDYTIDTTTGLITFASAPGNTLIVTAGCEFDVPVRFSQDVDDWLSSVREDVDENTISSLDMIELFDPEPVSMVRPYAGAIERVSSGSFVLSLTEAHTYIVDMQSAGLSVSTPDPALGLPTGGELWTVINGGALPFTVKDHDGTTLATLATNQGVDIHLSDDGVGGHVWYAM